MEVRSSPVEGLGVFATAPIMAGEVLEEVPFVLFPRSNLLSNALYKLLQDNKWLNEREIYNENLRRNLKFKEPEKYYFQWFPSVKLHDEQSYAVLPLGFGPIYNSSNTSNNADWKMLERTFVFRAEKNIIPDEEIRTFYGYFLGEDGTSFNCDLVFNLAIDMFNGEHRVKMVRFGNLGSYSSALSNASYKKVQQLLNVAKDGLMISRIATFTPDGKETSLVEIPKDISTLALYSYLLQARNHSSPYVRISFTYTSARDTLENLSVDFKK